MIRGKCPTCGKPFAIERIDDQPGFPFCSERCKLIDLGRWLDGAHALPEGPAPSPIEEDEDDG